MQFRRRKATERLYYAVLDNKTDEAIRLLNSGLADPNSTEAKDYQNETMLQKAVENNEALARLLLSRGANPNLKAPYGLAFRLDEEARNKNENLLDLLLQAGASPNAWLSNQTAAYDPTGRCARIVSMYYATPNNNRCC